MVIVIILTKIQMAFIRFEYVHFPMIALLANIGKMVLQIQTWKEICVIFFFFSVTTEWKKISREA